MKIGFLASIAACVLITSMRVILMYVYKIEEYLTSQQCPNRYPKESSLKEKWIKATGKADGWFPTKNSTICSIHFEESCYKPLDARRFLYADAVPTLKLRYVFDDQDPVKEKLSISKTSVAKKPAASSLESDDDDNADSDQEMAEKPQHVHYTSSKESQNGTMRLSVGSLFPETPAFSITQELTMDLNELSDKILNFYPAALGRQFTLTFQGLDGDKSEYIFTSASETRRSGELHSSLECNECGSDIVGFRYKCVSCVDYDLCSACEALGIHAKHLMMRIAKPIKLKRARMLMQQWCRAMRTAGITTMEEITLGENAELEPQKPEPSTCEALNLEPPSLAPLSSSTKITKGKATTTAKAKATKKSPLEEQPKKSVAKKRKIETSKGDVTFEIDIKEEPIEDFYNALSETVVLLPTKHIKLEYPDPLEPDKIKTEVTEIDPISSYQLHENPTATASEDPGPPATIIEDPGSSATTSADPGPAATTIEDPRSSAMTNENPGFSAMISEDPGSSATTSENPWSSAMTSEDLGTSATTREDSTYAFQTYKHKPNR